MGATRARGSLDAVRDALDAVAAAYDEIAAQLEPLPADDGAGLWTQPVHAGLSTR